MRDIARSLMVWYLVLVTGIILLAKVVQAEPQPGEVFKVYNAFVPSGDRGRLIVADPKCSASYCSGHDAPVVKNIVLDINNATRAEMVLEMWGGHIGSKKAVVINNNSQLELVKPSTPGTPECYFYTFNGATMNIPLNYLRNGTNSYYFKAWPVGSCSSEGYPGWYWVYSVRFIIYYKASAKPHPTGQITSPTSGSFIGDNPTVAASAASSNSSVREVLFVGYYNDFDWEGNGSYKQWHLGYKYGIIVNKIGQKSGTPYSVIWNTKWVPDQTGMKIAARITDANGITYMTPAVENIAFKRSRPVKMYKPSNVPTRFCGAKSKNCVINVSDDLKDAVSARLIVNTWAGNGDDRQININGVKVPGIYGLYHNRYIAHLTPSLSSIKTGTNNISIVGKIPGEHSFEINWPGPVLFIEYKDSGPDVTPPQLVSAAAVDVNKVSVTFNEPVSKTTAETKGNYTIDNSVTVSAAALSSDGRTVTLTTSNLAEKVTYKLTVNNVKDAAGNTVAANSSKTFTYTPINVNDGLVAYWDFEDGTGTSVTDKTGKGHTGTVQGGAAWTTGKTGKGMQFDGSDDYVSVTHKTDLTFTASSGFSVAAWVYVASMPSAYKGVVVKGGTGSHYGLWTSPDNKWVFGAPSNVVGGSITTGWHHVVLWQDGSSRKLYVDGSVSGTGSAQAGDADGVLQIGRSGFKTGEYFNGKVDEVRVYNKALTAQEISLLMSGTPVTGVLVPQVNDLPVSIAPNPLRIPGRIELSSGKVKVSHVTLHTIQGDLVRAFDPEAGKNIVWDGTGNNGQQVKPGVYMIRVYTDQGMTSRRVMVLH